MAHSTFADILAGLDGRADDDFLFSAFLDWATEKGLQLYPAQETAVMELLEGKNVILSTPTGSGKSLVASMLHFQAVAQGRRSVYTCPVKALVNEKWMDLCREFGPERVGLSTGDATVNRDAPILCCTAEILANIALSQGKAADIGDVVMDEFHYYADRERGSAWQIPLLTLPRTRFLLMSATLGATGFFEGAMTELNGKESVTVTGSERPVPLTFDYSETALPESVQNLVSSGQAPVYVVHFTQASAAQNAQSFTSLEVCTREERQALQEAIAGFRFSSPYGPDIKRWLRQGVGLHHAGLLPKYRVLTEKLAQQGLLKVICGTDTLGVGVNVPIRTVLFTQLCKFDGEKSTILKSRDFHQIAGRAGRKGYDDKGHVVAQAPEHVIENKKLEAKASQKGRGKKVVKRSPPTKGYVHWDEGTFRKLIEALPEPLESRFLVSHGMLLNVLSRESDGCRAMKDLIDRSHETPQGKQTHRDRAWQLFSSLVKRGIVHFIPVKQRISPSSRKVRVDVELQADFSMNQTLSLYLLDTIPLLDKEHEEYHLQLLSLVEAILEDPKVLLRNQLDRLKTDTLAELKSEGVEYDERMEKLDELEYPKPMRDFIYGTFNDFADKHPWVGSENIRPKSIAREMLEEYYTFSGYVKRYQLQRSEGLLLRHLNSVYKVLAHTVPDNDKNEAAREAEIFFGEMLRRVDSSLLEEWERLQNPEFVPQEEDELRPPGAADVIQSLVDDPKAYATALRGRVYNFLSALARRDFEGALEALEEGLENEQSLEARAESLRQQQHLKEKLAEYRAEHGDFLLDNAGRAPSNTELDREGAEVTGLRQRLVDSERHNDWELRFRVDAKASREMGLPVLRLVEMGEVI